MWSELGQLIYSRDSPHESSISSYSSSAIQQMLKIKIDRPKQSNVTGFTAQSTKYNSSYHKLKETRASNILQTLQKFDKKYVNSNRVVEQDDSPLSSLDKISIENLPGTAKTGTEPDTDITGRKPIRYYAADFEDEPIISDVDATEISNGKITGNIQANASAYLITPNKNTSKVQSPILDYSHVLSAKQKSQIDTIQDSKSETSIAEELSNESINNKPCLKVTVQAKNPNKRQPRSPNFVVTPETKNKATSEPEVTKKVLHSNSYQEYHQHEKFDYINAMKIKSDYNESKINSSSVSTIHTEPSASMVSSTDAQEKKLITASSLKTHQNEDLKLKILPFKVLTLDDLMDESQLSSKSEQDNPPRASEKVNKDVKKKVQVSSAKQNGHQETDEEIDEILEDSEPQHNTISMENSSNNNKLENRHSSAIDSDVQNLHLESSANASDSSKKSTMSESSRELVSVKQSISMIAKSENETYSKSSVASNSSFQEESVKSLKPQKLKLPKTFYSVSTQTHVKHNETVNPDSISPRLLQNKALQFSQGTQSNINSQTVFSGPQQTFHQHENESSLEQISANIILNEILKQQIKLTKHFMESQQRMHSAYLTKVNQLSANFKPVTLEDTEQYIKDNLHRRPL